MNYLSNNFASSVITWQEKFGRHNLPWQQAGAYATWISEIMLQQTQVVTVIDYFNQFMSRFPSIQALAAANIDEVLALWSGLGYYARARNIHKTAQILISEHNHNLPKTIEALVKLPGIGPSTAGAIMALGHRDYGIILDGNVKRILSRCFGVYVDGQSTYAQKLLWQISHYVTPKDQCDVYTQGIMDLGAGICHKHQPQCPQCPLNTICYAYIHHVTGYLPLNKPKKIKPNLEKHMVIFLYNGLIGLSKNPDQGIWGGLWTPQILDKAPKDLDLIRVYNTVKHVFTHQTWHIKPLVVHGNHPNIKHWFSIQDALQLGLPKPVRDIIEIVAHDQLNILQETA